MHRLLTVVPLQIFACESSPPSWDWTSTSRATQVRDGGVIHPRGRMLPERSRASFLIWGRGLGRFTTGVSFSCSWAIKFFACCGRGKLADGMCAHNSIPPAAMDEVAHETKSKTCCA